MIIISGCSWGRGEWVRGDVASGDNVASHNIAHNGLAQYIENTGKTVLNLSLPAGSNYGIANGINSWFKRNPIHQVDQIFIFQTDYARDWLMTFEEDYKNIEHANSLAHIMISRFYHRLNEISKNYNVKIYLIGGLSDTLSPELVKAHYAPLEVVCQSITNLLINNDHRVEDPTLSWYSNISLQMLEKIKEKLPNDQLSNLLKEIEKGVDRENLTFSTPEYFWPDGVHPNRVGHKKLFDYLVEKGYL